MRMMFRLMQSGSKALNGEFPRGTFDGIVE